MFQEVRLIVGSGEFVASGRIPLFTPHPGILIWGQRIFGYDGDTERDEAPPLLTYREVFTTALVDFGHDDPLGPEERVHKG